MVEQDKEPISKRKTIDVSKVIDVPEESGFFIGEECIVSSKKQAESFCKGFNEAMNTASTISGVDRKKIQYYCNVIKETEEENKSKESKDIDPYIKELLADSLIQITNIDPETKQTVELPSLLSQKVRGEIREKQCFIPQDILGDKICKGFEKGKKEFFKQTKLDPLKYQTNCKMDKDAIGRKRVLLGFLRILEE